VGTHSRRASVEVKREFSFLLSFSDNELDAGASRLHSHAGAWEREKPPLLSVIGAVEPKKRCSPYLADDKNVSPIF